MGAGRGLGTTAMLEAAAEGRLDVLVPLGADLFDGPDPDLARRALARTTVIVVDLFETDSTGLADVVLPAAGYAEVDGTTTNVEGRVSPLVRRVNPPGTARADWMIAAELAWRLDAELGSGVGRPDPCRASRAWPRGLPPPVRLCRSPRPRAPSREPSTPTRCAWWPPAASTTRAPWWPTPRRWPGWPRGTGVAINPYDFDRLGVAAGDQVRVSSARAELFVEVVPDDGCAARLCGHGGGPAGCRRWPN